MAYNGNKFYNGHELLKTGSEWLACIGRRTNGKSFWWLQFCVEECLEKGRQFGYVRRNDNDIRKAKVNRYFTDANFCKWLKKTYDYDGICYDCEDLYFFKYDENGKMKKFAKFGSCFAVSVAVKYKSLHYDDIGNIMFEEFITDSGYLENEWDDFNSIVSTVFRNKKARVILIGNTINRACPYFREMGVDIMRLEMGTISTIKHTQENGNHVCLSVEYCDDSTEKSGMFWGKAEKSINKGAWDTRSYPHLFFKLNDKDAEKIYKCFYIESDFCFQINIYVFKDRKYLYIYPYDAERLEYNDRDDIFLREFSTKDNIFNGPWRKRHKRIWEFFEREKVLYSDDLCGTEFNDCLDRFNPFI